MKTPFDNALAQFSSAAKVIKLESWIVDKLSVPDRVVEFDIELKLENGTTKKIKAFRSQHDNSRGPYKGGIRFHQNVSKEEVMALSMWMTWKSATTGIPYGGGKGGVIINPTELTKIELEQLSREYVKGVVDHIGVNIDIPAPDVNTDGQIMAWMVDEYSKLKGEWIPGVFTGKPVELGGSKGRDKATGLGGVFVLEELATIKKLNPKQTSIAVQGFGNVGYWFAKLAFDRGFKIVAISDSKGAIYDENGFDPDKALEFKKKNRTLKGFGGSEMTNEELLELNVDILVPAALENVITDENADRLKAKYVIEMANGPVTPEADKILTEKGIDVIPDVLANAGGVTVSYFEWVQNRMGYYWSEDEVITKLSPLMKSSFAETSKTQEQYKSSYREATYYLALNKVATALKLRRQK